MVECVVSVREHSEEKFFIEERKKSKNLSVFFLTSVFSLKFLLDRDDAIFLILSLTVNILSIKKKNFLLLFACRSRLNFQSFSNNWRNKKFPHFSVVFFFWKGKYEELFNNFSDFLLGGEVWVIFFFSSFFFFFFLLIKIDF